MDRITHPGVFLKVRVMTPSGLTQGALAAKLGKPEADLIDVLTGERPVTPAMAEKLGQLFDMTPEFWTEMQIRYDASTSDQNETPSMLLSKFEQLKKTLRLLG